MYCHLSFNLLLIPHLSKWEQLLDHYTGYRHCYLSKAHITSINFSVILRIYVIHFLHTDDEILSSMGQWVDYPVVLAFHIRPNAFAKSQCNRRYENPLPQSIEYRPTFIPNRCTWVRSLRVFYPSDAWEVWAPIKFLICSVFPILKNWSADPPWLHIQQTDVLVSITCAWVPDAQLSPPIKE